MPPPRLIARHIFEYAKRIFKDYPPRASGLPGSYEDEKEIVDTIARMIYGIGEKWGERDYRVYDPNQLARGNAVEREHTDSGEIAEEIAMDHLDEFPDYYDYLELMEKLMMKEIPIEDVRRALFRAFGRVL